MSTVILRGEEAVHYALVHGLKLNRDAGPDGPAAGGLTPSQGEALLDEHADLVWLETHIAVNSGEPPD